MSEPPNQLTAVRDAAESLLTAAGLHAFTYVPDRVSPPAVWVAPGDPYITFDGAGFGGSRFVNLRIIAIVAAGTNRRQTEALDELVLAVCDAFPNDNEPGFVLGDVHAPGPAPINGQTYLGCPVEISCEIQR